MTVSYLIDAVAVVVHLWFTLTINELDRFHTQGLLPLTTPNREQYHRSNCF